MRASRPTTVVHDTFSTSSELGEYLTEGGVDISGWGLGKAKTVDNLFDEVRARESTLQLLGEKVYRCLQVVKLVVRLPGVADRHLYCYSQRMADGRMRDRNVLPSEKMYAGEVAVHAAARAVLEELGSIREIRRDFIDVLLQTHVTWDEIVDSPSFPKLTTQYTLHQVEVVVPGLSPQAFSTTEGKKEHFWQWIADRDDDLRHKEAVADTVVKPLSAEELAAVTVEEAAAAAALWEEVATDDDEEAGDNPVLYSASLQQQQPSPYSSFKRPVSHAPPPPPPQSQPPPQLQPPPQSQWQPHSQAPQQSRPQQDAAIVGADAEAATGAYGAFAAVGSKAPTAFADASPATDPWIVGANGSSPFVHSLFAAYTQPPEAALAASEMDGGSVGHAAATGGNGAAGSGAAGSGAAEASHERRAALPSFSPIWVSEPTAEYAPATAPPAAASRTDHARDGATDGSEAGESSFTRRQRQQRGPSATSVAASIAASVTAAAVQAESEAAPRRSSELWQLSSNPIQSLLPSLIWHPMDGHSPSAAPLGSAMSAAMFAASSSDVHGEAAAEQSIDALRARADTHNAAQYGARETWAVPLRRSTPSPSSSSQGSTGALLRDSLTGSPLASPKASPKGESRRLSGLAQPQPAHRSPRGVRGPSRNYFAPLTDAQLGASTAVPSYGESAAVGSQNDRDGAYPAGVNGYGSSHFGSLHSRGNVLTGAPTPRSARHMRPASAQTVLNGATPFTAAPPPGRHLLAGAIDEPKVESGSRRVELIEEARLARRRRWHSAEQAISPPSFRRFLSPDLKIGELREEVYASGGSTPSKLLRPSARNPPELRNTYASASTASGPRRGAEAGARGADAVTDPDAALTFEEKMLAAERTTRTAPPQALPPTTLRGERVYEHAFSLGKGMATLSASTPMTILRRFCSERGFGLEDLGSAGTDSDLRWALYKLLQVRALGWRPWLRS